MSGGFIVIIIVFAISKCGVDSDKCDNNNLASAMSQSVVKRLLKSLSSVDLPFAESKILIDKKASEANKNCCYFKVSANVDSQNSCGVMIRNCYYTKMLYDKERDALEKIEQLKIPFNISVLAQIETVK